VRVTTAPTGYGSEQSLPQLIPDGFDVTTPFPAMIVDTDSVTVDAKLAVTNVFDVIVTVHGLP